MVTDMINDMNYACNLKESSGMVSNKYKSIFENLTKLALKAHEKGMMNTQDLDEFRNVLPFNKEMFSKEHTLDYSNLSTEIDRTLNDMKVQNLMEEDFTPTIKAA